MPAALAKSHDRISSFRFFLMRFMASFKEGGKDLWLMPATMFYDSFNYLDADLFAAAAAVGG